MSDIAFNLDQKIKTLCRGMREGFWELVAYLKEARENKIWKELGHESWGAYLAQGEIGIAERTVDNYLTVYNKLKDTKLLPNSGAIEFSRVALVAPKLKPGDPDGWLDKARELSWSDLRLELGKQTRVDPSKFKCSRCKHEFEPKCPMCEWVEQKDI
jgi:hypothetical protein